MLRAAGRSGQQSEAIKSHKVVPLHKLRESEKLQSAVGSSYERMRLRGLKRCDQHFIAPQ
jgi:hypothetical protein